MDTHRPAKAQVAGIPWQNAMSVTTRRSSANSIGRATQVVSQVAIFESRLQLRSPLLWFSVLASLALVWIAVNEEPATLWARSVNIAGSCLPMALAALLLGNTAALRDHVSRVGETLDALPTSRDLRMLGLVAASWAALVLSVCVVVVGVGLSMADDTAGSFLAFELLVGPALVPLGQAVGVALGRWIPNPLGAPIVVVVLAGLLVVQDLWPGEQANPAASPFLPWRKSYTVDWVQAEPRMPFLHLAYLTGLTGFFSASVARAWRALAGASLVIATTAVGLAGIDTASEDVAAAVERWAEERPQVCEEHNGVNYCVFDGYQPWIVDWAAVVAEAQRLVPHVLQVETVEQTTSRLAAQEETDPSVAQVHGRLAVGDDLTEQILAAELGMPATEAEAASMNSHLPPCMAGVVPVLVSGEARAVAYLILSELAIPGTIGRGGFGGTYQFHHVELSEDEAELALQIALRPEDEILPILHARWEQVTDSVTTTAELAEWFGLNPPQVLTVSAYESMDCQCTNGGVTCTGGSGP